MKPRRRDGPGAMRPAQSTRCRVWSLEGRASRGYGLACVLAVLAVAAGLPGVARADGRAASWPPSGFQVDLKASGTSVQRHVECYLDTIRRRKPRLRCNWVGKLPANAECGFGGTVPTIVLPRRGRAPRAGYVCMDEGYHGWRRLRVGRRWKAGGYRCGVDWLGRRGSSSRRMRLLCRSPSGHRLGYDARGRLVRRGRTRGASSLRSARAVRRCGQVGLNFPSYRIRAARMRCRRARRLVATAQRAPCPGPAAGCYARPRVLRVRGFRCRWQRAVSDPAGGGSQRASCRRAKRKVWWIHALD